MKTATIYNARTGEVIRQVKNLGWLLRHWKDVLSFDYLCYSQPGKYSGIMTAYLDNGTIYRTEWADNSIAYKWLDRPVFRGLPLCWISREVTLYIECGNGLTFPD